MKRKLGVILVILSIFITVLIFFILKISGERQLETEFAEKTNIMTRRLDSTVKTYVENLYAIQSFYDASQTVDRLEFKKFVTPIFGRYSGISALEWIPVVAMDHRKSYETQARNEGNTNFNFTQKNDQGRLVVAAQRNVYFPVFFAEPFLTNEKVLGFDLGSIPAWKKEIDRCLKTGAPIATEKIRLVQDDTQEYGILIFVPVHIPSDNKADRRSTRISGFILGVLSINKFVEAALGGLYPDQIAYTLSDVDSAGKKDILYIHLPDGKINTEKRNHILFESEIAVVDKHWLVSYTPTTYFMDTHKRWDDWAALAFGLMFSFLLGGFLFVLIHRSESLEIENRKRKQVQDELNASETRVRRLIESAPDALLVVDTTGHILFANKEVETVFGYPPDELAGAWHDILVPESVRKIHAGHRLDYFDRPYTRSMGEGLELMGLRKDGRTFPLEIKLSPFTIDNQTQVICIARDVTRQKKDQAAVRQKSDELNSLYLMGKNVSWHLSIDQVIQSAVHGIHQAISPDVSDIFLRDHDKLIPQPGHDKINGMINENTHFHKVGECLCGLAASTQKPVYSVNILTDARCTRTECKNAGVISFASLPLLGKDGLIGVMGVGSFTRRDFSREKAFLETLAQQVAVALENALLYQKISVHADELEQKVNKRTRQLRAAKEKAESADHLKSAFLASMSHELRTPLNSIIGFTGILLQGIVGSLNKEQKKQLTMVKTSANHLLGLINDILDLSKVEAGEVKVKLAPVDYAAMLEKVVQTLRPLSDKKQLELSYTLPKTVFHLTSDGRKIEQILINLINNAIKFTAQGSVKITCTIDSLVLRTSITDTGIGIAKDELETVFDTFYQTDSGLARKYEGTGLGLAICKKLLTLLGGSIRAESKGKNQGSTFSFTLPIEKGKEAP